MATSHIKLITSILMMALFSIAIITFAVNFGNENEAAINIADDSDFVNMNTQIEGNVSAFRDDAESTSDSFFESTANPGDQVSTSGGQFKIGIKGAMSITTSIVKTGFKKIFGSYTGFGIILTAFISLLVYIAGLLAYKAWFGRSP